ncbi:hypothetical protein JCM19046_2099 [Bacillus sp. JCM 19046]|uniref:O-antigen/teichoic acid export membrane protein n=1 Tax=Shouchella xiaoxiensis TaxID=766895 RepID=A0ABS2SMV2_9BACI|nr:hypothetical protein [Shouchella xiaoxiensis]MBM7836857.1 O-antigen/teichoic acid export membrane protein [Shouchella xiaoxiensis]GAF11024.1 hypothetical protein JCM19045_97 [Bacillus sp. JCM 19045]GAF17577.1 hypothetical protein JCM19046_2099 [Bacillus sp. JCM 19046]
MRNVFVVIGALLGGAFFGYVVIMLFSDIMNFPHAMGPAVLGGMIIGLLMVVLAKLNQLLQVKGD